MSKFNFTAQIKPKLKKAFIAGTMTKAGKEVTLILVHSYSIMSIVDLSTDAN